MLFYSLKNPSFPCFAYETDVGVMCLDIHPEHSHMVAGNRFLFIFIDKNQYQIKNQVVHMEHFDEQIQLVW